MSYVPGGYYNSSDEYYSDDDLDGFSYGRSRNQVVTSLTTPKQDVENALYSAVMDNNLLGIQKALDNSYGVTIDSPIRSGWTALIHASSNLIVPVVKYLLHQGANVDQNDEGFTPLLAACSSTESSEQVLQVVEVLLEHKACVNISDNHRTTPLMMACKNGHEAVVNLILPMAVADAEDDVGWTALFWAVNSNQYKICTLLIERNYSLCHMDRNSQTLMEIASSKDLHDIITLLESYDDSDRHLEMLWRKVRMMIDNQTWKDVVPGKKFCGLDVPPYYPDVANMLFGMNCEHLTPLFMKENVNLSEFLCMTDEKLEKIGVFLPFQRRIILNALEKFHKKRFRTITIAEPTNSAQFDVYNLLMLLSTHLKHLVVLNAGMRFANMKLGSLSVTPHDPDCEMAIYQNTLWNKFTPKDRNYCEACEKFEALEKNIQEYGKKLQHVNQFLKQEAGRWRRPLSGNCSHVSKDYPEILHDDIIIDNCCMQLVSNPHQFDIKNTMNLLYWSIISHIVSGLSGGAGLFAGRNYGDNYAVFEPGTRSTGSTISGNNVANPVAMLNASVDMLHNRGHCAHAECIRKAIITTLNQDKLLTPG